MTGIFILCSTTMAFITFGTGVRQISEARTTTLKALRWAVISFVFSGVFLGISVTLQVM